MKKYFIILLTLFCLTHANLSFPQTKKTKANANSDTHHFSVNEDKPYSIFFYYSWMTDSILNRVLRFNIQIAKARLYSIEAAKELDRNNFFRRLVQPLVSTVELAGNGTYQDDPNGTIFEFNPFLQFRWRHFPWDHVITTTFAIGEGVSMSSGYPAREQHNTEKAANDRKVLNFLSFEATFALPEHPNFQIVYRIHHRSGVFGLYSPGIVGSTAIGVGIRYLF